jgi:hypothetical protein
MLAALAVGGVGDSGPKLDIVTMAPKIRFGGVDVSFS